MWKHAVKSSLMQGCVLTWKTARLPSMGFESTDHHGTYAMSKCIHMHVRRGVCIVSV